MTLGIVCWGRKQQAFSVWLRLRHSSKVSSFCQDYDSRPNNLFIYFYCFWNTRSTLHAMICGNGCFILLAVLVSKFPAVNLQCNVRAMQPGKRDFLKQNMVFYKLCKTAAFHQPHHVWYYQLTMDLPIHCLVLLFGVLGQFFLHFRHFSLVPYQVGNWIKK